ncbi:MAG: baeRF3 domain-containing protein [Trichloromonadaceae bacterium]
MNTLVKDFAGLLDNCDPPCLSLYQPTHRCNPDNKQDPIRFGNLVKALEESLLQQLPKEQVRSLLEPFLALADDRDFWNHTLDGIGVLGAKGIFRIYKLQRPVAELAVVADSFHIKPLIRILQSADRYQVLGLNRQEIKLFEGNRDALDEIELHQNVPRTLTDALGEELTEPHLTVASYGGAGGSQAAMHHGHGGGRAEVDTDAERFFRAVDRKILEQHSQPSGLPLILAALPEHHHRFHEVSRNPFLIPESIDTHPDALASSDELRQRAWQLMEPRYLARLAALVEEFGNAKSQKLGGDDLAQVAKATVDGRVDTLLIEARREIPGRINIETGTISFNDLEHPDVDDMLDDLAILAMKMGGKVVIVPAERMPTKTGIAAIYRY